MIGQVVCGLVQFKRRKKSAVAKLIGLVVGGLVQFRIIKKSSFKVDWSGGRRSCSIKKTGKS
jgi:hypothetical protein